KDALDDLTVLDHVRDAGRYPQVVFQHIHRAVLVAHQIAAADMGPTAARRLDTNTLRAEVLGGGDDVVWEYSVPDYPLLVIDIVDEQVQSGDPLPEALLDPRPLLAADGARNDVQRPGPIDGALLLVVHGEGDTH